jgi:hypothetical protein
VIGEHLIARYKRLSYRSVGRVHWLVKVRRSVVCSRQLAADAKLATANHGEVVCARCPALDITRADPS